MDDNSILDEHGLLRRVPPWPNMIKYNENLHIYHPTSACFGDKDGGAELSVDLQQSVLDSGGTIQDCIKDIPEFGLCKLTAGYVRHELNPAQAVRRDPLPKNPHHALIIGKKTKSVQRNMAKNAEMLIQPKKMKE